MMTKRLLPILLLALLISCNNQNNVNSDQEVQKEEPASSMKEIEPEEGMSIETDQKKPGSVSINLADENAKIDGGQDREISFMFNKGTTAYENDDFEAGVEVFKQIIVKDPDNRKAYFNLGLGYFELTQYYDALKSFNNAIALSPRDSMSIQYRGRVYYMLGDFQNCFIDYNKVVEMKPNDPIAWYNRGTAKGQLKDYLGALQDFDKSIELDPDYAEAWFNRGLANYFQGRLHEACYDWRKAHSLGHYESEKALRKYCESEE